MNTRVEKADFKDRAAIINDGGKGIEILAERGEEAIKWKSLEGPTELRMLDGYRRPDFTDDGSYPEFKDWIQRTLETRDERVVEDTSTFLGLKIAYFQWLAHMGDDLLPKERRIHRRLIEGLDQLRQSNYGTTLCKSVL